MQNIQTFLKTLISIPGLSGYESSIRELIEKTWKPLTDELEVSRMGSLHALKRGSGKAPRPKILIAAHMDAIGLMVTGINDGFLRLTNIGGLDARVLPGQPVLVHGRRNLPGVIVQPPAHLLPAEMRDGPVPLQYLLVDTGLKPRDVDRLVQIGDIISFAQQPLELQGDTLAGHSLDNRVSVAALTFCLEELQTRIHLWDVWAVANTQEETTGGGARTSAFQLHPELAVVIDTTWGRSPGVPDHKTFPIGKGPTLGWGPDVHSGLHKAFIEVADKMELPYAIEIMPSHSGTDAHVIQVTSEGIPCMTVLIPIRYMHTPVEVVSMVDIKRAGSLIAEFIAQLSTDFMQHLSLD